MIPHTKNITGIKETLPNLNKCHFWQIFVQLEAFVKLLNFIQPNKGVF